MEKLFLIFILLLSINTVSFSQIYIDNQGNIYDQTKKTNATSGTQTLKKQSNTGSGFQFDKSKLSIGGNLGLQFGDYTAINISPQVGYDFSKYFTAGVGLGYSYFKESHFNTKWTSSYLSFDLFGRFYPIDFLVLSVQPEISRMWQTIKTNGINYSENKFVPSFLIGGGLRYGGVIAMIQYDVIQDNYSPYGDNLVYTIGYTFNF